MREIESEDSCYQDVEWTADLEVHLLFAMVGIKPVGIHRSFHMLRIWDKFTSSINKNVPPRAIWKHLETMYDLPTLDEAEGLQFPNDFKEFSLPGDEFEELMAAKRKCLSISLETENTDESSSDVVLGSLIDREPKETDDNVEADRLNETTEITDASSKKKKMSLSLKKRRRNEEEKNKGDNTTSDEGVSNSETGKKKRQKRESETVTEVIEEIQKVLSEDDDFARKNNEDSDKELVGKSKTPKDRKQARNKKRKVDMEDENGDVNETETKQDTLPSLAIFETATEKEEDLEDKRRKKKGTPAKTKEAKLRRKASTEKSEEGTDVEGPEEEVRTTRKMEAAKNDSVNMVDGRETNVESKKRTRKQDEELEKKNTKEIESSSAKRCGKEMKTAAASQKRSKLKDEMPDLREDRFDSDDDVFSKRRSISSPALKAVDEQDGDDSDAKRLSKDDRSKKSKRDKIVNEEIKSDKKSRRGSLKAPQLVSLKSETSDSRRLSRGDEASRTYSSDDTDTAKHSDTEKNSTKKDSVSKLESRKAERTYGRAKQKVDTSFSQAEPDNSQANTPSLKKDRQRDSLAKVNTEESPANKRKSIQLPASSTKRAARSVTSTPEPTTKRRRVI